MAVYRLNAEALWKAAAKRNDTSQKDIANRTGIDKGTVSNLVNGRKPLSLDRVMRLSEIYNVSANKLAVAVQDADLDGEAAA